MTGFCLIYQRLETILELTSVKLPARDELQIAAFEPSRTLDHIIDFVQKELFYLT